MTIERRLDNAIRKKYIALRRGFNKPVIGIMGMLGKTSVIHMLSTILSTRGNILSGNTGTGNWQNNIHNLEQLNTNYDYAFFEFAYYRGNNFAELLRLIKPNIGIITNIGDAHLSYLGNMIKNAVEKSAVVKYLAQNGLAILNKDDELSSALSDYIATTNIVKYGLSNGSDFHAADIKFKGPKGMSFILNGKIKVNLPIYSIQDVYNTLAAIACAVNLDFNIQEIVDILEDKFELSKGRGRVIKINKNYILDESYIST
ncbi:MAG TPA: hypothetical protein ENO27_02845, partial [Caldithrix sp.]|nr:hypothetical protein [Caldithrix sp.]